MRSDVFLQSLRKEKIKEKKKRENESSDLWLATSKEKGKESRLMSYWNGFFSFWVHMLGSAYFESTLTATRKRKWKGFHLLTTLIFQIILSLLHESWVFYVHLYLFFLDSEIFLIWIIKKIFYIKFNCHYWRVHSSTTNKKDGESTSKNVQDICKHIQGIHFFLNPIYSFSLSIESFLYCKVMNNFRGKMF